MAFAFNYLALQNRQTTVLIAVAAQDTPGGVALTEDMVELVPVGADFAGLEHLASEDDLARFDGWVLARPLLAGEPLGKHALIDPGIHGGSRTMSIPVAEEHAAGGTLVAGDRVDVISIVAEEPGFVATDLEVISVAPRGEVGLTGSGPYHIVVAVEPDEALALARAIADGSLEVLRSTGAEPVRG